MTKLISRTLFFITVCMAASITVAATPDSPQQPKPARILIATGVDYVGHHWKETAPVLRKVLEQDPRIEARIVEDPEFLATSVIADYDVIFMHFYPDNHQHFAREQQVRENLDNFVKQGKGLVLLHLACGAFEDWPEFAYLAGKVWDRKTYHDPRGPFQVHITQKEHPITRGLQDFETDDELYVCLTGDRPVEILAMAHSKMMDKDYPMAFVLDYGKGRVFHTPLGHDALAIEKPGTAELLRRGCLWTAGQQP
jgi:uncharacterized protein